MFEAQIFGQNFSDRAFAAARRPVDGDLHKQNYNTSL
jgi:hypothetical protein